MPASRASRGRDDRGSTSGGVRTTVLRRGKLRVASVTLALLAAVAAVAALPSSAANCTVTVKLITGQVETFQLPPGAPLSDLHLATPVASVTESCPQQAPPPATSTSSSTTSTTSTTPSSSNSPHSHK